MEWSQRSCQPCEGIGKPMEEPAILQHLTEITEWNYLSETQTLSKKIEFKNFFRTMGFVNAVAYIANEENHHPDMHIGYDHCELKLKTHALDGITENDFILASKIDQLTEITIKK